MSTFKDLSYEQRVALMQRLQSGGRIWAPRGAGKTTIQALVKRPAGDKNPEGKAAKRRLRQMQRAQPVAGVSDDTYVVGPQMTDEELRRLSDDLLHLPNAEAAYALGLAPGKTQQIRYALGPTVVPTLEAVRDLMPEIASSVASNPGEMDTPGIPATPVKGESDG